MISKELLSVVLKIDGVININIVKDTWVTWTPENKLNPIEVSAINIYELAHKCKEWANNKSYFAFSGTDSLYETGKCQFYFWEGIEPSKSQMFTADCEINAIFKACQWILDNEVSK